ncbi:MAG: hypothetical protein GXP55_25405, partial [Deltaproteobacteria bacterium]|nr:hypothetical protein [Deltaproteobacteria bacterium]
MTLLSHISLRPLALFACIAVTACSGHGDDARTSSDPSTSAAAEPEGASAAEDALAHLAGNASAEQVAAAEQALASELDRDWPLHGLVTGARVVVRKQPNADAPPVGWL